MKKTQENNRKWLDLETLYKDALYLNLIHKGYREERAKLEIARLEKRKKDTLEN